MWWDLRIIATGAAAALKRSCHTLDAVRMPSSFTPEYLLGLAVQPLPREARDVLSVAKLRVPIGCAGLVAEGRLCELLGRRPITRLFRVTATARRVSRYPSRRAV